NGREECAVEAAHVPLTSGLYSTREGSVHAETPSLFRQCSPPAHRERLRRARSWLAHPLVGKVLSHTCTPRRVVRCVRHRPARSGGAQPTASADRAEALALPGASAVRTFASSARQ